MACPVLTGAMGTLTSIDIGYGDSCCSCAACLWPARLWKSDSGFQHQKAICMCGRPFTYVCVTRSLENPKIEYQIGRRRILREECILDLYFFSLFLNRNLQHIWVHATHSSQIGKQGLCWIHGVRATLFHKAFSVCSQKPSLSLVTDISMFWKCWCCWGVCLPC